MRILIYGREAHPALGAVSRGLQELGHTTIWRRPTVFNRRDRERDADLVVVAYGTAARVAHSAVAMARRDGMRVGLFRPISLWPFPELQLREVAGRAAGILVVELSAGQMVEDVRLSVDGRAPVFFHGRTGGMVPTPGEVVDELRRAWATTSSRPAAGGFSNAERPGRTRTCSTGSITTRKSKASRKTKSRKTSWAGWARTIPRSPTFR